VKLVVDTSALIFIVEKKIDVSQFLEHEVYIPDAVWEELRKLAQRSRKARAALQVAAALNARPCPKAGPADAAVLECAQELGAVLLTGDRELADRARRVGVPVGKFHKGQLAVA